jgi:hypothetical protein
MKLKRKWSRRKFLTAAGASILVAGTMPLWPGRRSTRPNIPVKQWRRGNLYEEHDLAG